MTKTAMSPQPNDCHNFGQVQELGRQVLVTSCGKSFSEQRLFVLRSEKNEVELKNFRVARNGTARYLLRYQGEMLVPTLKMQLKL